MTDAAPAEPTTPGPFSPAHIALLRVPDGVPSAWVEGVARLLVMPAPRAYDDAQWQVLREDAFLFLREWAAQAHGLGWDDLSLFGVHRHAPQARLSCMGLVPVLLGCAVVAMAEGGATIITSNGVRQSFRRQATNPAEVCLVWALNGGGP